MDSIGKGIQKQLNLTESQVTEFDLLFRDFNREMFFPLKRPFNLSLHKISYLRKLIQLLNRHQFDKFKELKNKAKRNQRDYRDQRIRRLKVTIAKEYKVLNLNSSQIDRIVAISNQNYSMDKNNIQEKIKSELKDELNDHQLKDLELIFNQKNNRTLSNKIESIKRDYHYLGLHRDQALALIELKEKEVKEHQTTFIPEFKKLSTANPQMKHILNDKQFERYEENRKSQLKRALVSQKKDDDKRVNEIKFLKEKEEFLISKLLPLQCELSNEIIQSANQEDKEKIYSLRKHYENAIDVLIAKSTSDFKTKYLDYAPNNLHLSVINISHYFINISPSILADSTDFNVNIYSSIKMNEAQKERINRINQLLRMHLIESMERKISSYATIIGGVEQAAFPTHWELYKLILLDEKPEVNILKMQKRQSKFSPLSR